MCTVADIFKQYDNI